MRRFGLLLVCVAFLLCGCGADEGEIPSPTVSTQATPEATTDEDVIANGDSIEVFYSPSLSYDEIETETVSSRLGFEMGLPKGWTSSNESDQFVANSEAFQYTPALLVTKERDDGASTEELITKYEEQIQQEGGQNLDTADGLSIGSETAIGILYNVENNGESLEKSQFLFRIDGEIYSFVFTCTPEQAVDFYVYMDVMLQSLVF